MNPLEFALWSCLALTCFTYYKVVTMRLALHARSAMVPDIAAILSDDKVSSQLKRFALKALHDSASPGLVPRLFIGSIGREASAEVKAEAKKILDEHNQFNQVVIKKHLFRVNFLAAPHWYALFFCGFIVAVTVTGVATLGMKTGFRIYAWLESLFTPERFSEASRLKDC